MTIENLQPLPALPEPAERRRLRELYGATQDDVAAHIGATRKMVWAYETGNSLPTGERRKLYAALLASWAHTESQVSRELTEIRDAP